MTNDNFQQRAREHFNKKKLLLFYTFYPNTKPQKKTIILNTQSTTNPNPITMTEMFHSKPLLV